MTTNTATRADHALMAETYLAAASELARQAHEWDKDSFTYAQTLATIGIAEALLAIAAELRDGVTVGA
jgi:hypothetical protein